MASLNLRPLGDRVVVKPLDREEVTKSGIVLPDTAKEKPQQGEVLAVGPGRILDSGERVMPDVKRASASCSPSTRAPSSSSTRTSC